VFEFFHFIPGKPTMTCLFLDWTFVDMHIVPHLDARGLMCFALTRKSFTQPEIAAALKRIFARSLRESLEEFNARRFIPGRNFIAALKRYMRPSKIPVKFTGPRWKAFRLEFVVQRVRTRDFEGVCGAWDESVTHMSWIFSATFQIIWGVMVMNMQSKYYNHHLPKNLRFIHPGYGPLPHPAGPHPDVAFLRGRHAGRHL